MAVGLIGKAMGASMVIGVRDLSPARLEFARQVGASITR